MRLSNSLDPDLGLILSADNTSTNVSKELIKYNQFTSEQGKNYVVLYYISD